jgi:NAD(P)H-dependent FMN reductase
MKAAQNKLINNNKNPLKIKVIIGSTRQGRFGDKPAHWIAKLAEQRPELDVEVLDLRDYPMPFFDNPVSPAYDKSPRTNEVVIKWAAKIAEADGFIIVTPEYNHSFSAVLKNAIDHVYYEWNKKAVAFVSYGSVAGARSIEQLRLVAVELQMAPIRNAVHITWPTYMAVNTHQADDATDPYEAVKDQAGVLLNDLTWWTQALKTAREQTQK